ncbi:hypothetical protein HOB94_04215 [bacterium]|nr:hypothetical protein [bacterium]
MDSMNKSPEIKGKIMSFMVLFVALIEVVAIYGLIIAFKVLSPVDADAMEKVHTTDANKTVIEETVEGTE